MFVLYPTPTHQMPLNPHVHLPRQHVLTGFGGGRGPRALCIPGTSTGMHLYSWLHQELWDVPAVVMRPGTEWECLVL